MITVLSVVFFESCQNPVALVFVVLVLAIFLVENLLLTLILKYQLFPDATVELSLDSTQNNQKMMPAKTLSSHSPQGATNSPKPQPSYEEVRLALLVILLLCL